MYRMVVTDLDGTLLNSKKQISEKTAEIIKKLKECHIYFVMASGRSDVMMKSYIRQLQHEGAIIGCDGALVRDLSSGEIIYEQALDSKICRNSFRICREKGLQYYVFTADALVGDDSSNERLVIHQKFNKTVSEEDQIPIKIVEDLSEFVKNHQVYKIVASHDEKEYLDKAAEFFRKELEVDAIRSGKNVLAVKAKGVSKAAALKILAKQLGIAMEEMLAFGDEVNDIEMLEAVGCGVAMENADDIVKEHADGVTMSNDEDGVAKKIRELFNIEERSS